MKIAVAYDGTDGAKRAAQASLPIARASDATLVLVRVVDPRIDLADFKGSREEALAAATRHAETDARAFIDGLYDKVEVHVATTQRGEDIGEAIGRVAGELGVEVIAIATRRAGGVSGFFLGSVTQQLMQCSDVPVMVVHA